MSANHPVHRAESVLPARLDRRERHQLQKMQAAAALGHHEIALRRELIQAQMLADTAVAHTAMACVAGTAVSLRCCARQRPRPPRRWRCCKPSTPPTSPGRWTNVPERLREVTTCSHYR